ncbi:MAG: thiamine-monophosphate kinase [Candidatus Sumerlaeota bacterium]|nr:thiamine-monophosphate kinase [Candidatus Sumerlaeota bacterium]
MAPLFYFPLLRPSEPFSVPSLYPRIRAPFFVGFDSPGLGRKVGGMDRTLKQMGEDGMLALLGPVLRRHTAALPLGTGDDVAITGAPASGERLVWTIDAMVEGTHFRFWEASPGAEWVGRKLAASNLSDLASKGATPLYALVSFGAPGGTSESRIREFYDGLERELAEAGARLIGGDTVRAPQWTLSLTLVGALPAGLPIAARSRARPGSSLYVTGHPGRAGAGFLLLDGLPAALRVGREDLIRAHARPKARLAEGRAIIEDFPDAAMLDVSDGIGRDAARLCERSGVGIVLEEALLPVSEDVGEVACAAGKSGLELTLFGGEDYELLFATEAPEDRVRAAFVQRGIVTPVTRIGCVVEGNNLTIRSRDGTQRAITPQGFEHFA